MKSVRKIDNFSHLEMSDEFRGAFDLMEKTGKNVFISGRAGTGKSTLLEYFRDQTTKNVVILAPTGVAAVNVKGQTIHSFFRFQPNITPDAVSKIRLRKSQRLLYEAIDTIVIDEISMVRADLLDSIDAFLQLHGKYRGMPFGGVQMIFFGDLYQLPPVVTRQDRQIFKDVYKSPYFFDANSYPYLRPQYVELKKIFRQTERHFIDLLNSIRERTVTYDDICLLNERATQDFEKDAEDFYIYLTSTNALADKVNQQKLQALKTRPYRFEGEIEGDFDKKNLPTNSVLDLKYGCQVMLLNNDPNGQWVNGSIGKIVSVQAGNSLSDIINVELSGGKIVEVSPFTWQMFRFQFDEETQRLEAESVGSFVQYPLRLAWAITIHKSQGKTFSHVIIDIGRGTFAPGQVYVALSRCTSFEGLILTRPIYKHHIILDQRIVDFMKKISNESTQTEIKRKPSHEKKEKKRL